MSGPSETLWSNNPNAPQIPTLLYVAEKENFAGLAIGLISYGTQIYVSAYPCSSSLFDPPFRDRRFSVLPMHRRAI